MPESVNASSNSAWWWFEKILCPETFLICRCICTVAMNRDIDNRFKILLVGDTGVGKSSLLLRYCDNKFDENQVSTIGVDFKVKTLTLDGKRIQLAIWDTAGQERYRTLTSSYYRGAHGVVLLYDATNRDSYSNLDYWLGEIQSQSTYSSSVRLLLSSKADMGVSVVVPLSEGQNFASRHGMLFGSISSKVNQGVDACFDELVSALLSTPELLQTSHVHPPSPLAQTPRGRCSSLC